ncbi:MAG: hypothetical protein QW703_01075 [Candidatus Aenigmatarchaeota archaeon]
MIAHWKLLILGVCLMAALLAIGLKAYPYGRVGVEIAYISPESPARDMLHSGMQITELNGIPITSVSQWQEATKNISGPVTIKANGQDYTIFVNDSIGIDVLELERTNLDFGLDIKGGTRILLKPEGNVSRDEIEEAVATLETRANLYGLKEITFRSVGVGNDWYIQIEAAGIAPAIIDDLLARQGSFEAKILKPVKIGHELVIGDKRWKIEVENDSILINGKMLSKNDSIELDSYRLVYQNISEDKIYFVADLFTGRDIQLVYTDPQHAGIMPYGNVWMFYFGILVSEDGAKRFAELTQGVPKHLDIASGEEYLDSKLYLYLDNQLVSELNIGASLGGQYVQTAQIQGTRESKEAALAEKLRLQAILRSGSLPVKLAFESIDVISPRLGTGFLTATGITAIFAVFAVLTVSLVRYRRPKIALPMILIVLSEIVIVLGIAAMADWYIWLSALIVNILILSIAVLKRQAVDILSWAGAILIPLLGLSGWTIDLPAIAGIIAAIGTGIDDQIVISDEVEKRKEKIVSIKDRIKYAFFMVFGSAATLFAAMIPLLFIGVGLVRGFAITTMVGVLVGVLITRPAYAHIIEIVKK